MDVTDYCGVDDTISNPDDSALFHYGKPAFDQYEAFHDTDLCHVSDPVCGIYDEKRI